MAGGAGGAREGVQQRSGEQVTAWLCGMSARALDGRSTCSTTRYKLHNASTSRIRGRHPLVRCSRAKESSLVFELAGARCVCRLFSRAHSAAAQPQKQADSLAGSRARERRRR